MIFENHLILIEKHDSDIPWIKIFSKQGEKELSDCPAETRNALFTAMIESEKAMIEYYRPEKINIASFGNYLPKVHIHVQARFKEDSHFPESMWGEKKRESSLNLPNFDKFAEILAYKMQNILD